MLHEHKDLTLNPKHPCKKPGTAMRSYDPAPGEGRAETVIPKGSAGQTAQSKFLVQWQTLAQEVKWRPIEHTQCLFGLHISTQGCTYLHTHVLAKHTHTGTLESPWARTLAHCTAGRTGLSPPSDCLGAPRHLSLPCSLLGKFPEAPFSQDTQATSSPTAGAFAG